MQKMPERWYQSLYQEDPLEEGMATHSSTMLGKSHGQKSLVGYSAWSCKGSDTTKQLSTQPVKIVLCIKYYFLIQSQIYLYSFESRKFWQIKIISNSTPYIHLSSKHIHKLHARWHNHNWASWNFLHFWHPFNSASKTHLLWHRNDVNSFSVSQLSRVQIPLAVLSEKQNHWDV